MSGPVSLDMSVGYFSQIILMMAPKNGLAVVTQDQKPALKDVVFAGRGEARNGKQTQEDPGVEVVSFTKVSAVDSCEESLQEPARAGFGVQLRALSVCTQKTRWARETGTGTLELAVRVSRPAA